MSRSNLSETMHIVYASDDKFAEILGVSVTSLLENNKDMHRIVIYILDSGITAENHQKLESLCASYPNAEIVWLPAKDISKELSVNVNLDRGSLSQYARLFVSSVLPSDVERVLYLDCDIIIAQSLRPLWTLDMQEKTIAALMDAFSTNYRKNIALQPDDIMFNSGVMLIDLTRWKQLHIEQKLMDFIKSRRGQIQQGDQGALNAILSRDTYCFAPKFNSVTIFYDFTYKEMLRYRKPPKFYSEKQVLEAIEHPVIIHFTTSFLSERPWIEGCQHRYVSEWMRYKAMSPWKDTPLWPPKKGGAKTAYKNLMQHLPRSWMIGISSLLQVYGRPFYYSLKK